MMPRLRTSGLHPSRRSTSCQPGRQLQGSARAKSKISSKPSGPRVGGDGVLTPYDTQAAPKIPPRSKTRRPRKKKKSQGCGFGDRFEGRTKRGIACVFTAATSPKRVEARGSPRRLEHIAMRQTRRAAVKPARGLIARAALARGSVRHSSIDARFTIRRHDPVVGGFRGPRSPQGWPTVKIVGRH